MHNSVLLHSCLLSALVSGACTSKQKHQNISDPPLSQLPEISIDFPHNESKLCKKPFNQDFWLKEKSALGKKKKIKECSLLSMEWDKDRCSWKCRHIVFDSVSFANKSVARFLYPEIRWQEENGSCKHFLEKNRDMQVLNAVKALLSQGEEAFSSLKDLFYLNIKKSSVKGREVKTFTFSEVQNPPQYSELLPKKYKFIHDSEMYLANKFGYLGHGGGSIVYLVQDQDGKKFAAKFKKTGPGRDPDEDPLFYDTLKRVVGNDMDIYLGEHYILKTFVKGQTLARLIGNLTFFNDQESAPFLQSQYKHLYKTAWENGFWIGDSNPGNVMFDFEKKKLIVIEGRGIVKGDDPFYSGFAENYYWIAREAHDMISGDRQLYIYAKFLMYEFFSEWQTELSKTVCKNL